MTATVCRLLFSVQMAGLFLKLRKLLSEQDYENVAARDRSGRLEMLKKEHARIGREE
jgi:hypothetical protein